VSISVELRMFVRERARFACEYCRVTETDSGGELTIDHYQPSRRGGLSDDPDNLLYCCHRCNQYKSDYWPNTATDIPLGKRKILSIPASCHAERSEASRLGPFAGAQGDRGPTTGQLKRSASLMESAA